MCEAIGRVFRGMVAVMEKDMTLDDLETPITKVCQISVDAAAMSQVIVHSRHMLAEALMHLQQEGAEQALVRMLTRARGEFESLASSAHGFLLELLQNKLRDLLASLVFVDWDIEEMPMTPNENIIELTEYLGTAVFYWPFSISQLLLLLLLFFFLCCTLLVFMS